MDNETYISFRESALLNEIFLTYVLEHNLTLEHDKDVRLAIRCFNDHVTEILADEYMVNQEEGEINYDLG